MTDAIDAAAGLLADDAVFKARRFRLEFVEGAELCRHSVLTPKDGLGLETGLRIALARRIAGLNADAALIKDYDNQLAALSLDQDYLALAGGAVDLAEPLETIARHVDLVTLSPHDAAESDIALLSKAGLSDPQIVALSELIAFVNFQTRVATGLRLMRSL